MIEVIAFIGFIKMNQYLLRNSSVSIAFFSISATSAPYILFPTGSSGYLIYFLRSRVFYNRSGSLLSCKFLIEALSMLTIEFAKFVLNFWMPMIFYYKVSLVISL